MVLSLIHESYLTVVATSKRKLLLTYAPPAGVLPPIHRVEDRTIAGPGGELGVRVYYPVGGEDFPVLMWFHGGGWVLGGLHTAEYDCRQLANDVGCAVVSVDYRLAPETPFPGAIDDCFAATLWVAASAAELGIDARRIGVGGDSAGGNLAACVAYRARERDQPLAFQLLVYPVIDADFCRASYVDNGEGFLLTRDAMKWYWDCYVPDPEERTNPEVAPIHARDLAGLSPALIITAEFDPLRDEGEAYGEALRAAGVAVEVQRYDGMIHGFFNVLTGEPVDGVVAASAQAAKGLRQAFDMD